MEPLYLISLLTFPWTQNKPPSNEPFAIRTTNLRFTSYSYIPKTRERETYHGKRKKNEEESVYEVALVKFFIGTNLPISDEPLGTNSSCADDTRHPGHNDRGSGMRISVWLGILVFEVEFRVVSLQALNHHKKRNKPFHDTLRHYSKQCPGVSLSILAYKTNLWRRNTKFITNLDFWRLTSAMSNQFLQNSTWVRIMQDNLILAHIKLFFCGKLNLNIFL